MNGSHVAWLALLVASACTPPKTATDTPKPASSVTLFAGIAPDAVPAASPGPCPTGMAALSGGTYSRALHSRGTATVRAFCFDITEVTADAYAACVRAGQCSDAGLGCSAAATYGAPGKGNHPVNCVDWYQAVEYCKTNGKRLPSDEEWEWAARGQSNGWTYPWGDKEPTSEACWSGVSKRDGTCPVGSMPAGDAPGGIHDLVGNVAEWTSTENDVSGFGRPGGSWVTSVARYLSASAGMWMGANYQRDDVGFRCAR